MTDIAYTPLKTLVEHAIREGTDASLELPIGHFINSWWQGLFSTAEDVKSQKKWHKDALAAAQVVEHLWNSCTLRRAGANVTVTSTRGPLATSVAVPAGTAAAPLAKSVPLTKLTATCVINEASVQDGYFNLDSLLLPTLARSVADQLDQACLHGVVGSKQMSLLADSHTLRYTSHQELSKVLSARVFHRRPPFERSRSKFRCLVDPMGGWPGSLNTSDANWFESFSLFFADSEPLVPTLNLRSQADPTVAVIGSWDNYLLRFESRAEVTAHGVVDNAVQVDLDVWAGGAALDSDAFLATVREGDLRFN